jgi:hypothetical protein
MAHATMQAILNIKTAEGFGYWWQSPTRHHLGSVANSILEDILMSLNTTKTDIFARLKPDKLLFATEPLCPPTSGSQLLKLLLILRGIRYALFNNLAFNLSLQ